MHDIRDSTMRRNYISYHYIYIIIKIHITVEKMYFIFGFFEQKLYIFPTSYKNTAYLGLKSAP